MREQIFSNLIHQYINVYAFVFADVIFVFDVVLFLYYTRETIKHLVYIEIK